MDIGILKQLGSEWKKGEHHRIYFNNVFELLDAEITYHKTGTFDSVEINGKRISNSKANSIKQFAKVWYDVKVEAFNCKDIDTELFEQVVTKIKSLVAAQKTTEDKPFMVTRDKHSPIAKINRLPETEEEISKLLEAENMTDFKSKVLYLDGALKAGHIHGFHFNDKERQCKLFMSFLLQEKAKMKPGEQ